MSASNSRITLAPGPHKEGEMARGQALTLIYIALTAASQVFLNHVGSGLPAAVSLFYMAAAASLIFNLWEVRRIRRNHTALCRYWPAWTVMSVSFVLNWLCSWYSVTHAPADFFIAIFFLSSALCNCVRDRLRIKGITIVSALTAIWWLSGVGLVVLSTSLMAGAFMFIYYLSSMRFSQQSGLGPVSVVSLRCYLLLVCCAGYLMEQRGFASLALSTENLRSVMVLIIANMVLPSFLSQTCLQWVGVTVFTFMNSLIPMLAFLMQSVLSGEWPVSMLLAVTLATLTLNHDRLLTLAASLTLRTNHKG
ncbi:hypothetical protein RAC65_11590 [Pantoea sp. BS_8]|uniref:hypothetical protein n=1 Tax=Pantoea TaxID=53335 RepID=UPI00249E4F68|nr:hypothetical protein [Pantoea stewartii]